MINHPATHRVLANSWRETERTWRDGIWHERVVRNDDKRIDSAVAPLIHRDELERANCKTNEGCPRDKRPTSEALIDLRRSRKSSLGRTPLATEYRTHSEACCCVLAATAHVGSHSSPWPSRQIRRTPPATKAEL